jgi:hypothetical protein
VYGAGVKRFEHGDVTRHEAVLQSLSGFARMTNFKSRGGGRKNAMKAG